MNTANGIVVADKPFDSPDKTPAEVKALMRKIEAVGKDDLNPTTWLFKQDKPELLINKG